MEPRRRRWGRSYSRREFLQTSGKAGAFALVARAGTSSRASATPARIFTESERRTLDAALARMIPAEGPGDWSAATLGAGDYIERLLAGTRRLYAGGPYRVNFARFWRPTRAKRVGWGREIRRLRRVYRKGLDLLDVRAGGDFAGAPEEVQDAVLAGLDTQGHPFFAALYDHAMEGVYAHPVYGGNKDYEAWRSFDYEGDVHGRRFPKRGSEGSWNEYGGYSPEEMGSPGGDPGGAR